MKNIFLALVMLFVVIAGGAQDNKENTKAVHTTGVVKYEKKVTKYRAKVMISLDQLYYADQSYCTLEELKKRYFDKLKEEGISEEVFIEDKLSYLTTGYQKDGTVLNFETTVLEDILKLTSVRMAGVVVNQIEYLLEADEVKIQELRKEAFEKAKKDAEKLAKAAGKSLGEVISISEHNTNYYYWTSYFSMEETFSLSVSFEMK